MDEQSMDVVIEEGCRFLRIKIVEGIKDGTVNVADQMLRSSLRVLGKYTGDKKSRIRDESGGDSSMVERSFQNNFVEQKPKNGGSSDAMSVFSKISRISFKDTQSMREGRNKIEAQF